MLLHCHSDRNHVTVAIYARTTLRSLDLHASMDVPLPRSMIFIDHFSKPHGAYILSHFHSDHMHGLRAGWRFGFIHCSEVTARLLRARFTGLAIRSHALEEPFCVEDPTNPGREVFATFVEANHCPGSVIVVVEGLPAGPIVNTGDFRYYDGLLDSPALRHLVSARDTSDGQRCQKLCLDTTWAHAAFERLPSKIESIGYVLDLIEVHHSDRVFLHSHCLGDEEILGAVADMLEPGQNLCFTDKARFEELQLAQVPFVNRCELLGDGPLGSERFIVIAGTGARARDRRLAGASGIEISCSTLWWARRAPRTFVDWRSMPVCDSGVFHVLFAMHSSLGELRSFAQALRPRSVHSICATPIEAGRDRDLVTLLELTDAVASDRLVVGDVPMTTTTTTTAQPAPVEVLLDDSLDNSQLELLAILESQPMRTTTPGSSATAAAAAAAVAPGSSPTTTTTMTTAAQPRRVPRRHDSVATTEVDSDSSGEGVLLPMLKRPRQ